MNKLLLLCLFSTAAILFMIPSGESLTLPNAALRGTSDTDIHISLCIFLVAQHKQKLTVEMS